MMIKIDELLYDIDFRLNKVATSRHQSIPREDIIIALNEAQIQLVKQRINLNNIYKLGTDSFNKRMDDLRVLIPEDEPLSLVKVNDTTYLADDIPDDYMFFVKCYVLADKGSCTDRVIDVNLIPHNDVREYLNNDHLRPSFEYQETVATLNGNGIEVYTDGFVPKTLYLRYIRYPRNVDYEGYIHLDGTDSMTVDSELPYYLKDDILNLAIQLLAASTENLNAYEAANNGSNKDE